MYVVRVCASSIFVNLGKCNGILFETALRNQGRLGEFLSELLEVTNTFSRV